MSVKVLYLIGQPGAGKTTLVAQAIGHQAVVDVLPFGMVYHGWAGGYAVQLGFARLKFSGTDALDMSVQPKVEKWLSELKDGYVLGEGDRLGNRKFFQFLQELPHVEFVLAYLDTPDDVAADRRMARAADLRGVGDALRGQNKTWLKGRQTKVRNLAEQFEHVRLSGERHHWDSAVRMFRTFDVIKAIRGEL